MNIDMYEEHANVIRSMYRRDKALAEHAYRNLSDIFIQDSVANIDEPFYGTSMARKGRVLFELQGLFI